MFEYSTKLKRKINGLKLVANLEHKALHVLLRLYLTKKRRDKLINQGILNSETIIRYFLGTHAFNLFNSAHFLSFSGGFRLVIAWQHTELPSVIQEMRESYLLPKEGDVVIDVGANYGFYSLVCSRLIGKEGSIIAFEPETRNYEVLLANLRLNDISNVKTFRMALGDFDGETRLYLNDHPGMHSMIFQRSRRFQTAQMKKLDTILKELEIGKIDLIKLDAEGAELKILQGALKTILLYRPTLTIAAYHYPKESEDIEEFLKINAGFYRIVKTKGREGSFIHALC